MNTTWTSLIALALVAGSSPSLSGDEASTGLREAFKTHCLKCHGGGRRIKGKVDLKALATEESFEARPALLEKLIGVLTDLEMPPENEPPLPSDKREQMISRLKELLEPARRNEAFVPTPIRRMNRFQYNNAVVDLLELDRDIFALNERLMRRRDDYFRPKTRKMPDKVRVTSRPLSKDIDNQRPEGFRASQRFLRTSEPSTASTIAGIT